MPQTSEQRALRRSVAGCCGVRPPVLDPGPGAGGSARASGAGSQPRSASPGWPCRSDSAGPAPGHVEVGVVAEELGRALARRRCWARPCWPPRCCWGPVTRPPAPGCCRKSVTASRDRGSLAWTDGARTLGPGARWPATRRRGTGRRLDADRRPRTTCSTGRPRRRADRSRHGCRMAVHRTASRSRPATPGVDGHRPCTTMDQTRRMATVRLAGRRPGTRLRRRVRSAALAGPGIWPAIALAAEQVGAAARALELTVDYTKTRIQFGRPIASFQALQFRLADLHVLVESAQRRTAPRRPRWRRSAASPAWSFARRRPRRTARTRSARSRPR